MRKQLLLGVILVVIAFVGCDRNREQRERLQSEISNFDLQLRIESEAVSGGRLKVASLEKLLYEQQAELSEFKDRVEAYLMNHKMAVTAIAAGAAGGAVAMDPQNEFSDDAKAIGAVVGVVAILYALANPDEVAEVIDQMIQADSHVKSLEAQIAATTSALADEKALLQSAEERFSSLQQKRTKLRAELESLDG